MAVQSKKINALAQKIRDLHQREKTERDPNRRALIWATRWPLMLYHEFLRDDVKVRAESLAFLMIFSLLPLIAGAFFVFTIFTQFAFVQDALQGFIGGFLDTIPEVHREFVRNYVIDFKNSYLASLNEKSGSMGIFALFILIWVGLQTFGNVDRMLNHIWGSERQRPFLEQVRNFLVVAVAAPLVLIAGLSVPLILRKLSATQVVFSAFPILSVLLNLIITPAVILGTFFVLYRYVPTRPVKWKSALSGALFAMLSFQIANYLLRLYFIFGTQSAYGKAAVIPLIGFWIYIVWIIIISGAEVSFLCQNQKDILYASTMDPTLKEGGALLALLGELHTAHRGGKGPVDFDKLRSITGLPTPRLHALIGYLLHKKVILECVTPRQTAEGCYALGREASTIDLEEIFRDFFHSATEVPPFDLEKVWLASLDVWWKEFAEVTLATPSTNGTKKRKS